MLDLHETMRYKKEADVAILSKFQVGGSIFMDILLVKGAN